MSRVRMQAGRTAGERLALYMAVLQQQQGDCRYAGTKKTPRTGRGGCLVRLDDFVRFGRPLWVLWPAWLFWHQRQLVAVTLPVGQLLGVLRLGVATIDSRFKNGYLFSRYTIT